MIIEAHNIGHAYNRHWLFRSLDFIIPSGNSCAIIGANGSGKSTLMQIIAGRIQPNEGKIIYHVKDSIPKNEFISPENLYTKIAWTAPMIDLYKVLTVKETLMLHAHFKPLMFSTLDCLDLIRLGTHSEKPVKNLSSGMLQRLKVGLALFSVSDLILLDEPTSFMDELNAEYILSLIQRYQGDRTLILASNLPHEWQHINRKIILDQ